MLENTGVHHLPKSALQENASCNHIIHVVMRVVTFYAEINMHARTHK